MMDIQMLIILFLVTCVTGAFLAIVLPPRSNLVIQALIGVLASVLELSASLAVFIFGQSFHVILWQIPGLGWMSLHMDRLSALFMLVTGLFYLPISIFSSEYMKKYFGRYSIKSYGLFAHLLFASIVLTLLAGDVISFLIAWELMGILSYLLVNYEHKEEEVTNASYLLLSMSEVGSFAAAFGLLMIAATAEDLSFAALRNASDHIGDTSRWSIFLLTFFGFGVKAGLVPGSSWLPRAHPAAPANCSAILAGVILNLGIYGIVRVNVDILPVSHPGQGLVVLIVGSLSALIGILYATIDNDMKKMLAHSSIENMGIITACLGAGFVFLTCGQTALGGVAFVVGLYHTVNHSLYKALLFMGAGAVDSKAGGRDMNRLGGLIRKMPWTSACFLVGVLSISALPPFNGFVSEWLTLQTLLQSSVLESKGIKIVFALCGAALALTAALAVTCFVKAYGMSFLGLARSKKAENAVEVKSSSALSMGILAVACLVLGVIPTYVIPVIDGVVSPMVHTSVVDELVPPFFSGISSSNERFSEAFMAEFHDLGAQVGASVLPGRGLVILHQGSDRNPVIFAMSTSYTFVVLAILLAGSLAVVRILLRRTKVHRKHVWDGGMRRLFPEMTYTATGFSNPVRVIFEAIFSPSVSENARETIAGHFRTAIRSGRKETYVVDRLLITPVLRWSQWLGSLMGVIHSASVNTYACYVLLTLLVFLLVQTMS